MLLPQAEEKRKKVTLLRINKKRQRKERERAQNIEVK
jgi:hypothetical protein